MKKEANQALEPTTLAVMPCAPSRTSHASQGRGSSLTLGEYMTLSPLLGKNLKDDEIIELLDDHGIAVVYDFDRLHENTPDKYWAAAPTAGFQCRFDAAQVLDVIFMYVVADGDFTAIDPAVSGLPMLSTVPEVERHASETGDRCVIGHSRDTTGLLREWALIDQGDRRVHYEFREGVLSLVTLSLQKKS